MHTFRTGDAARTGALLLAIAAALGSTRAAQALPVAYLEAYASASDGEASGTEVGYDQYVSNSRSGSYSGFGSFRGADASSNASFGVLRAASSASASLNVATSGASARVHDFLTITAPGVATGTPGTFAFSILADGSMDASHGRADWMLAIQVGSFAAKLLAEGEVFHDAGGAGVSGDPFGGIYASGNYGFRFGEAFSVDVLLGVGSSAGSSVGSGSAFVDFLHTASWQGIAEVKLLGSSTSLPDYGVTSASGADYSRAIPEPGTLWLVALGVTALAARSRNAAQAA
jgi:hypothetical protein